MFRLAVLTVLAVPCLASADTDAFYPSMVVSNGEDLVLEHTSVIADVQVGLAVVSVRQTFGNPYDEAIDATYVFPLPEDAAVRAMEISCGGRVITGEIMTRAAARKTFEEARHAGRKAALLEQQRTNVFTQEVASICPGETVEVDLEYVEQIDYEDGKYELVFPTTMGPRFDPQDLNEPPLVMPTRDARQIDIAVDIAEGMPVESVWSDTHDITISAEGDWGALVELTAGDQIPNKDFSLVWTLAGNSPRAAAVMTQEGDGEGFIAVTIEPQILQDLAQQRKRELLFVLDSSCSMRGQPWSTAVKTVELALDEMGAQDTFNLVKFSNAAGSLFQRPQPATPENRRLAKGWLQSFEGGGTHMRAGITHSLNMPGDPDAMRLVLFLTDGYIGGEEEVFRVVEENLGDARLFSLGIGSSVNRLLLEGLAEMGRGAAEYQLAGTPIEETVEEFYGRIAHPSMTDITVDFGGLEVYEQYPAQINDLWAGQPLRVVAKYRGHRGHTVRIDGLVNGDAYTLRLPIDVDDTAEHEAVSTLWARRKIHDLSYQWNIASHDRNNWITDVALDHHIVTHLTSLVAVEETKSACGSAAKVVNVPSYQPEGVTGVGSPLRANGSSGVGGLIGAKGTQIGSGGLGSRGSGLGGGGTAEGQGGMGTRGIGSGASGYGKGGGSFGAKSAAGVGTVGGDPIILGALDRSLVDEVVKRHMNQIRYCYQRELTKNPKLVGKIVIRFTIEKDGTVRQADVKTTTMNNEAVEQCIVGRFKRMQFTEPKGGGIVVISYPFLFKSEE